jgi:hypothetical protein
MIGILLFRLVTGHKGKPQRPCLLLPDRPGGWSENHGIQVLFGNQPNPSKDQGAQFGNQPLGWKDSAGVVPKLLRNAAMKALGPL